ncbi:Uncharacterised protein [Tsukamurella paurometabola]|uniref:Uncharacterized protein n=2 Tax=Tsukamurella paurometabola TaxID=2061 RepID=A0A3P8K5U3_TSUPA|nr:Uncharacterised protein [Tsukamurella paurometabola]
MDEQFTVEAYPLSERDAVTLRDRVRAVVSDGVIVEAVGHSTWLTEHLPPENLHHRLRLLRRLATQSDALTGVERVVLENMIYEYESWLEENGHPTTRPEPE